MEASIKLMNKYGAERTPFLFIIDFEMKQPLVFKLNEVQSDILYDINGISNVIYQKLKNNSKYTLSKKAIDFSIYKLAFDKVKNHLNYGNSYLVNLTQPTEIEINLSLENIFLLSQAKYKLCFKDEFVVFSPEIFIQIKDQTISSFPMKGTIDAAIPNAAKIILSDEKETAEHYTIVDLIRNDLSMVAKDVKVEKFRYIDHLQTSNKNLLQVSSKISGLLPSDYCERIGDIIFKLLPAGSISGAPKIKTLDIIKKTELYNRGYYTGIVGLFDGQNLDSGVMIRFIEKTQHGLVYKSGGGITTMSEAENEYQELIDKVYVPIA
ncbi:MAG: aminodeoxychorismate synthase component I [Bacteroidetes bacterium]|nr:aminodeoxychorismate synthase component I [Bacteroidota bacterium]